MKKFKLPTEEDLRALTWEEYWEIRKQLSELLSSTLDLAVQPGTFV
jgi:hypothetical protein